MREEKTRAGGGVIRVALAGTPNAGKTLLFNLITGGRARVANWPGTTVEKRTGYRWHRGYRLEVVDLPGLYTLNAWTLEQEVASRFLVEEKPDVVVAVVDATSLERGLYLTLQLMELQPRLVVALNKVDLAESLGIEVDWVELSQELGCPVVPTVALRGLGLRELLNAIVEVYERDAVAKPIPYESSLERLVEKIEAAIRSHELGAELPARRIALGILEGDKHSARLAESLGLHQALAEALEEARSLCGGGCELAVSEARARAASGIAGRVSRARAPPLLRLSDLVDKAVLDRHLSIPLLVSVFWALFTFTFKVSEPLVEAVDAGLAALAVALEEVVPESTASSLLLEGLLPGVGAVLALVPVIVLFFLGLGIVEDTGYLARISALLNPLTTRAELSGRSVLPLAVCLGCNVPGVRATRVVYGARERLATMLAAPFISCPARLPVYAVVAAAVFGGSFAPIALMYLLSFTIAFSVAAALRKTLLRGDQPILVAELPEYSPPALANVKDFVLDKTLDFLKRASTVIILGSVIAWALLNINVSPEPGPEASLGYKLAMLLEPLFAPMGFTWETILALMTGLIAKEVVVSTLAVVSGVDEEGVVDAIRDKALLDEASGLAFMTFVLLYMPCVATLGAIWAETRSARWTLFSLALSLALAYTVSLAVYIVARAIW